MPHCLSAYYASGAMEFMAVKVVATSALMEVVAYTYWKDQDMLEVEDKPKSTYFNLSITA